MGTEMNPHIKRGDTLGNPRLWSVKYRVHPKLPDLPFAFERDVSVNRFGKKIKVPLRYLDDIYGTLNNLRNLYIAIEKPRQCQISEFLCNATFFCCDTMPGISVLYVLQDEKVGKKFCMRRINEPIQQSSYLSQLIIDGGKSKYGVRDKKIDSLMMKKFGNNWFYMLHSTSDSASRSPDGDIIIFDEYDKHDLSNETSFRSTVDNSDIQAMFYVSTPTLPDYGVDLKFKSTSMGKWTISCAHCLQDFLMDSVYFFGNGVKTLDAPRWFDGALRIFVCPHCGEEVKPVDKQLRGRYVHEHPELIPENRLGFQFPNLILPHVTADLATKQYKECLLEPGGRKTYLNEKLGEASINEESTMHFNRDMMLDCRDNDITWRDEGIGTHIGVDWGKDTHVTVWKRFDDFIQLFNIFVFPSDPKPMVNAEKVVRLLPRYHPIRLVCDFGAGQEQNKYVMERAKDVFYAALHSEGLKKLKPEWNEKNRVVKYELISSYTAYAYWYAAKMVKLPPLDHKLEVFIQHHVNSMLLDLNDRPAEEPQTEHLHPVESFIPKVLAKKGPIHFLSSSLFAFLDNLGKPLEDFSFSSIPENIILNNQETTQEKRFTMDTNDFMSVLSGRKGNSIWRP